MIISSLENSKVKNLIKLKQKKYRDITNTFIVEGEHLVSELFNKGLVMEIILLEGEVCDYDISCTYVTKEVMRKISNLDTCTNILAVCKKKVSNKIVGNKVLLLDEIQDPGNLGTIIRSSVAFDVDTIILSTDTVDLYNYKVLRSTQGVFCHINIVIMDSYQAINYLKENNYLIYGTNVNNGVDVRSLDSVSKSKFCLVMGNEGKGLKEDIQDLCDKNLYIDMNKNVESLNVGIACGILLYELRK